MSSRAPIEQAATENEVVEPAADPYAAARTASRNAEWVSGISYWCDYLTIIDVQGLSDPALRMAG